MEPAAADGDLIEWHTFTREAVMRRTKPTQALPIVVAAVVLSVGAVSLAGCTAGPGSSTSAANGGGSAEHAAAGDAAAPIPAPSPSSGSQSGKAAQGGAPLLANRSVIYTADITVRADDIRDAVDQVEALAAKAGGVVYDEKVILTPEAPDQHGTASATVTLKVPPDQLGATLDAIGGLGTEVSRSQNSDDVTQKVVDVNARIDAARASISRLTELLDHAGTVADLLSVENQLAQRDADLESLEQQQKSLAAQTSMATITAHLMAKPPVTAVVAKANNTPGFLRGLAGGWHAFTKTVTALLTAFGAVLPFLGVLAALAVAAYFGRRKLRGRRPQES